MCACLQSMHTMPGMGSVLIGFGFAGMIAAFAAGTARLHAVCVTAANVCQNPWLGMLPLYCHVNGCASFLSAVAYVACHMAQGCTDEMCQTSSLPPSRLSHF